MIEFLFTQILEKDLQLFWKEVEKQKIKKPPKQVIDKLVDCQYPNPGELASLALFWGGIQKYSKALKRKESKQYGSWLNQFKQAAVVYNRIEDTRKTIEHNLDIVSNAWKTLEELSKNQIDLQELPISHELYDDYWLASYYLSMALIHLKYAKDLYVNNRWTPGYQVDFQELDTNSVGLQYERLLFRSSCCLYGSQIQETAFLPGYPDGWFQSNKEKEIYSSLLAAVGELSPKLKSFKWMDQSFAIQLDNDCKLIVEAAKNCNLNQPIVNDGPPLQGLVQVHTPAGMFIEQYHLDKNRNLDIETLNEYRPENSLACQPTQNEKQKINRNFFRRRILCETFQAINQPFRRTLINSSVTSFENRQTNRRYLNNIGKGHILYRPY